MGLLGTTFKIASSVNDSVPFTPSTKTVISAVSKLDYLNLIPSIPVDEEPLQSDVENVSKRYVSSNAVEESSDAQVSKIKEKLILSRRVQMAIKEEDQKFNVENILKHDNGMIREKRHTVRESHDIDDDYSSESNFDQVEVSDALSYLQKALQNERVANDEELFERFFNLSMVAIINGVFQSKSHYNSEHLWGSLEKPIKFQILQLYLNDDSLVDDFKLNFAQRHRHANKVKNSTSRSNLKAKRRLAQKTRVDALAENSIDNLILKWVQFMITLFFRSFTVIFTVGFPLLQLIWFKFLELNDEYDIITRLSNLIISIFTLFVDQLFLFLDSGVGLPYDPDRTLAIGNDTYLDIAKKMVSSQISRLLSPMSSSSKKQEFYEDTDYYEDASDFEASSTPL